PERRESSTGGRARSPRSSVPALRAARRSGPQARGRHASRTCRAARLPRRQAERSPPAFARTRPLRARWRARPRSRRAAEASEQQVVKSLSLPLVEAGTQCACRAPVFHLPNGCPATAASIGPSVAASKPRQRQAGFGCYREPQNKKNILLCDSRHAPEPDDLAAERRLRAAANLPVRALPSRFGSPRLARCATATSTTSTSASTRTTKTTAPGERR